MAQPALELGLGTPCPPLPCGGAGEGSVLWTQLQRIQGLRKEVVDVVQGTRACGFTRPTQGSLQGRGQPPVTQHLVAPAPSTCHLI